ncbi:SDR family oxidoreductase [Parasphingorhabdus cellanae]|uniref:SDR family oxidoreductase n=1 Tax=Parasphingorhabdus cellanae TaxID=2806553 RepID=A0ABX7T776_9SPHN|nr:SDR family oxidoreductase [Parasphingorhabdus cellanae]QTD57460.1 SDR family oxidoreductase [Parasphingorhabdus cellanae]
MRILVTGATGFIGGAIAKELLHRRHNPIGLARSASSADALLDAGLDVHRGDITDPESVTSAVDEVDAVIHTAFNHDFSRYTASCREDGQLLNALARKLVGANKTLIAASATIVGRTGSPITEQNAASEQIPRSSSEAFLSYADDGVRTGVVRLPPTVHGDGDTAFIPALTALAREHGVSAYPGDGSNRWPAVHRDDAARLFCDAVEQGRHDARYHAVAETGIAFRTIAEAIGEGLGVPCERIPNDQAESHFGWLAMFAALDNPASSEWTQETTGWAPREMGLISNMRNVDYFNTPSL